MTGFVEAYANYTGQNPNMQADPMCFFGSEQVPITSFLAQNIVPVTTGFVPYLQAPNPTGQWHSVVKVKFIKPKRRLYLMTAIYSIGLIPTVLTGASIS